MRPLALIPGLMCDAGLFSVILPELSRSASISVADVSRDDTMAGMARRLLRQIDGKFDLLGFSMGGFVAHEVVAQAPHRVRRLALLDTNANADPPAVVEWRQTCIERARRGEMMDIMRTELVPRYFASDQAKQAIAQGCLQTAEAIGAEVFVRQFSALADRIDHHDTLGSFKKPALVLRGEFDELCNKEAHMRMVDALPNGRYAEISGAAHLTTLERPDLVSVLLRTFLEE